MFRERGIEEVLDSTAKNDTSMEICDVLDESGTRTGRTVVRGTELTQGEYYLVVHVWIRGESGEYLVQQRSPHLASDPGIWATTVGHVLAGEDSISGAIREAKEEMGVKLSPAHLRQFDRLKMETRMEDLWLAEVTKSSIGALILGSEVIDWKWASKSELEKMVRRGDFFRYSYFSSLPE
jgi:8-oxo-dGTP diphosphatase